MSRVRTPQYHKKWQTDTSQKKLDGEHLLKKLSTGMSLSLVTAFKAASKLLELLKITVLCHNVEFARLSALTVDNFETGRVQIGKKICDCETRIKIKIR